MTSHLRQRGEDIVRGQEPLTLFSKLGVGDNKAYTKSHPGKLGFPWQETEKKETTKKVEVEGSKK